MKEDPNTQAQANAPFAFRRLGGMDQFVLQTDEEWRHLAELDRKLWMALSCPVQRLEFSKDTLDLLDADHDGRIRVQEVKDAVQWLCQRIAHPSRLSDGQQNLELDNLRTDTPEGQELLTAARLVLEKRESGEEGQLGLAEIEKVLAEANGYPFNGDGIVPADSAPLLDKGASPDVDMEKYIRMGISIIGAKRDASGKPGLDATLNDALKDLLEKTRAWRQRLKGANLPLGENTAAAWTLYKVLHEKIDDFFTRCKLLAYAPEAAAQINEEGLFLRDGEEGGPGKIISAAALESLPISRANPDAVLDLEKGLNPAWADRLAQFFSHVQPLAASGKNGIAEAEWKKIRQVFEEYSEIMNAKPAVALAAADAEIVNAPGLPPLGRAPADDALGRAFLPASGASPLAELSDADLAAMLSDQAGAAFAQLVEKDLAAPSLAAFQDLRRLGLYHAHLFTFLNNFLSFTDFYNPEKKGIFQTGTLYMDGRACYLCVPVDDVDDHARLSEQSHLCLIYCQCQRKKADGADEEMTIAAALTDGNVASLIEGRHGLFIDNNGQQWDTKILRVLHNPISLEEAVWAPYIRLSNMISEQVHKLIEEKDKAVAETTGKFAGAITKNPREAAEAVPKPGFDFAKGAGIFAAVSVALSVLSAAFAYIANSLASLGWWWPLALVGIFLCISGPSVLIAWFKLRKRGLGPLLDASNWAVNKVAPINLMMGATLTKRARVPADARRELNDPYAVPEEVLARRRRRIRWMIFWLAVLLCLGCFAAWCIWQGPPQWLLDILKDADIIKEAKEIKGK